MWPYLLITLIAFLVAALTLFSGFGLGTLLMPAFAMFFPVEVAIAATAIVHLANNLFKLALVARHANWQVVLLFGVPAALAALIGAFLLETLTDLPPLAAFELAGQPHRVTPVKLVVGVLLVLFATLELHPRSEKLAFGRRWVPLGGLLSGFFGGLSGNQGALRAAFLVRLGLTKEAFVGTTNVCAVIVDVSRLTVYGLTMFTRHFSVLREGDGIGLVIAGSLAAFIGSLLGVKLIKKVTMRTIQYVVGVMLLLMGVALATGLLPDK
jgi:uncharacterized membrane protein YfcA